MKLYLERHQTHFKTRGNDIAGNEDEMATYGCTTSTGDLHNKPLLGKQSVLLVFKSNLSVFINIIAAIENS